MNAVEQSKECGESELVSGGGEQISGQMNGPVVYASIRVSFFSLYRLNAVIPLKVINDLLNPE